MEQSVLEQISRSRLFAETDLDALAAELADSSIRNLLPSDVLLEPTCSNSDIFVVLSGELIVSSDLGETAPLAHLRSGECVGEVSIIDNQTPSAYVVAASATCLLVVPQMAFWRMMTKMPKLALNLMNILVERFRKNNKVLLESIEMQRRYRDLSETDLLTGMHSRSWCMDVFPKQLDLCERIGQPLALAMLDIDHFKHVNDQYGHSEGDIVLKKIGHTLLNNLRDTDLLSRFGGEEFIVMMPATPLSNAIMTMERLRKIVAAMPIVLSDSREIHCTVSIGLAGWQRGVLIEELISFADQAMYQAKEGGRNRVVVRRSPIPKVPTVSV